MRVFSVVSLLTVWMLVSLVHAVGLTEAALVGVWHMNDTSGAITDVSGNDFHGTFTGGAADYGHLSPFGAALRFNGASHVNVGNGFDLNERSFTIEAWIRPDADRTGNVLIASKREPDSDPSLGLPYPDYRRNLHLRLWPDGRPQFGFYSGDMSGSTGAVADAQWQHIAFVFEKTGGTNNKRYIYVDGVQVGYDTPDYAYYGTGGNFLVGSWNTSEFFRGLIDEARVYDEAVDAATIANHAGGLYESYQPEAVVLVHHNDDEGTAIQDSSFWNNHGTYSGTTYQTPGRFLYGLGYNGVDTYTQVADSTEINFAERSFSIEAWVKQEAGATGEQLIFSKRDANGTNNQDMHLRVRDNGSLLFGFYGNDLSAPAGSLTQDEWHHVAFVMDVDAAGNNRYIYVDGVQVAYDTPTTAYQGDGGMLQFGRWYAGENGQHFRGAMDESRVYNYALDAATVAKHAAGQYAQYQPEVPLLVMHMEDRSGAIRDATEVYSGTYTGTAYRQDGVYGCGALGFDGSSRVEVATDRVLDFDNRSFTIEMWVNQTDSTGEQVVMSKTDSSSTNQDMHLRIYEDGRIRFDWRGNALDTDPGTFESGDWHHLAFIYDYNNPDAGTGIRQVFYDGQLADEQLAATPYLGSGGPLYIGSWGSIQYFRGLIDEFRVYNYALSAETIADHYNLEYETFAIPEPGTFWLLCLAGIAAVNYRRRCGRHVR